MLELPGKNKIKDNFKFDRSFLHLMMVDEKYNMVASHLDTTMRKRIQNFEYVDLARLLP